MDAPPPSRLRGWELEVAVDRADVQHLVVTFSGYPRKRWDEGRGRVSWGSRQGRYQHRAQLVKNREDRLRNNHLKKKTGTLRTSERLRNSDGNDRDPPAVSSK